MTSSATTPSPSSPPWLRTATELAAATRRGEVSCREVVRAALDRVEATNGHVNAVTLRLDEDALAAADALDAAHTRGVPPGPLHGVPVTVKDNVDVAGQRTPNGMPSLAGLVAPAHSPVTANRLAAVAVVFVRTNTPEVSLRPTTDNPLYGLTRNPWSDAVSCGGSSGGAGAAVLAGMCAVGHGNDIGGSIRIPALHCGVPGLKPSQGRVPAFVPSAASERPTVAALMSVQGPLARSVADLRLALGVMAVADARDPWHVPAPLVGPPLPRRAAVVRTVGGAPTHPSVGLALDRAARALEAAGWEVEEVDDDATPGLLPAARLAFRLHMTDLDHQLTPLLRTDGSDAMRRYWEQVVTLEEPLRTVGEYVDALASRTTLQRAWAGWLARTPVLVAPLLLGGLLAPGDDVRSDEHARGVWLSLRPSIAVNLLGLPAVQVPTGLDDDGLPCGVQLVGPRLREDVCLAAAEAVEAPHPSIPALLATRPAPPHRDHEPQPGDHERESGDHERTVHDHRS